MDSFDYFFERKLRDAIRRELVSVTERVMGGAADHPHYMRLVGQHDAYQLVLQLIDDVHKELVSPDLNKNRS